MANRFPRGHAQTKELIRGCATNGVVIESLADAPSFRFIPVDRESRVPRYSGPPSGRGTVAVGKNRYRCKNWKPEGISLAPMYNVPMTDTPEELNRARFSWSRGNPNPLRKYLSGEDDD